MSKETSQTFHAVEKLGDLQEMGIEKLLALAVMKVVDFPEEVQFTVTEAKSTTMIEILVNDQDKPKLIGKQGRTMNAIRTIISAMGGKIRRRYSVELLDDDRYTRD
jgi:predicted RNA-binding protein YlqC (UPF0109 family)